MPLLSVIVLARDRAADTRRCLAALRRHTPGPLEVVLYDNASKPAASAAFRAWARAWPALRVVRNKKSLPFARAVNAGMRAAKGEHVCWLNNDAVVGPGWREGLESALLCDPRTAAAGPRTSNMAPPDQVAHKGSATIKTLPTPSRRRSDLANRALLRRLWGAYPEVAALLRETPAPWDVVRPDISVMVPAHRSAAMTRACLRALERGASGRQVEVVLIAPAGKTTGLKDATLLPVKVLTAPSGTALTRAFNLGRRACRGRTVLLMDPRGRIEPGALSDMHAALRAAPAGSAVGPLSQLTRLHWQNSRPGAAEIPYLRGGCLMLSRASLAREGGLDERLLWPDAEAVLAGLATQRSLRPGFPVLEHRPGPWTLTLAPYHTFTVGTEPSAGPGVPLALGPAGWSLALQGPYLGAPLGRLGAAAESGPAVGLFSSWRSAASGPAPEARLLPARIRLDTAAEAASWMLLWWRALWADPAAPNRFVLWHLYTRGLGLSLALAGREVPFDDWSALLDAAQDLPGERGLADALARWSRDEPPECVDRPERSALAPEHAGAIAGLMSRLAGRLEAL